MSDPPTLSSEALLTEKKPEIALKWQKSRKMLKVVKKKFPKQALKVC
jgi:hypothetical protein